MDNNLRFLNPKLQTKPIGIRNKETYPGLITLTHRFIIPEFLCCSVQFSPFWVKAFASPNAAGNYPKYAVCHKCGPKGKVNWLNLLKVFAEIIQLFQDRLLLNAFSFLLAEVTWTSFMQRQFITTHNTNHIHRRTVCYQFELPVSERGLLLSALHVSD